MAHKHAPHDGQGQKYAGASVNSGAQAPLKELFCLRLPSFRLLKPSPRVHHAFLLFSAFYRPHYVTGSDPGERWSGEECGLFDPQQAGKTQRAVDDHGAGNVGRPGATLVGEKPQDGSNREARTECWNPTDVHTTWLAACRAEALDRGHPLLSRNTFSCKALGQRLTRFSRRCSATQPGLWFQTLWRTKSSRTVLSGVWNDLAEFHVTSPASVHSGLPERVQT